ncbi:unnamed protein product [Polarella glacialis]|uniref:C3H1-type domain-containing protein n=1 Tax=Polarella glacialis TaxID=89957 RepID=A0A813M4W0_POLGL|nr:unnamed protein product [Polarella glacialis]
MTHSPTIGTPAMLQGTVPDWAHPTPSPSTMPRHPNPDAYRNISGLLGTGNLGGHGSGHGEEPSLQQLLLEACTPFFNQMMMAVEAVVQQEMEGKRPSSRPNSFTKGGRSFPGGNGNLGVPTGLDARAFGSLFDPSESDANGFPHHSRTEPVPEGPEEGFESESERGGQSVSNFHVLFSGNAQDQPSKSEPTSDSEEDAHDPRGAFAALPLARLDNPGNSTSAWQVSNGFSNAGITAVNRLILAEEEEDGNQPLYLQWSGQGMPAGVTRLTRTVSPVTPTVEPGSRCKATARQSSMSEDDSPESPARSVVVCRHWKSKGWCRLESECKFSHPDHKCGTGVAQARKTSKGSSTGAVGAVGAVGAAGVADASPHASPPMTPAGTSGTATLAPRQTGSPNVKAKGSSKAKPQKPGRGKGSANILLQPGLVSGIQ